MPEQTISDVLSAAADLIEPPGAWIQGEYWAGPKLSYTDLSVVEEPDAPPRWGIDADCFCLLGAIGHVLRIDPHDALALENFLRPVGVCIGLSADDLANWNDAHWRTQAEVVAALRAAAEANRQPQEKGE